jgi:hypothetical protein
MEYTEREPNPINFSQLDRATVFTLPGDPKSYFVRVDQRHCQNQGKETCNHVCVATPNSSGKWDIRWLLDRELDDNDQVMPVGRV